MFIYAFVIIDMYFYIKKSTTGSFAFEHIENRIKGIFVTRLEEVWGGAFLINFYPSYI